jgi:hypothetical protein
MSCDFDTDVKSWISKSTNKKKNRCTSCVPWLILTKAGVIQTGVVYTKYRHAATHCNFQQAYCRRCYELSILIYNGIYKTTVKLNPLSHTEQECPHMRWNTNAHFVKADSKVVLSIKVETKAVLPIKVDSKAVLPIKVETVPFVTPLVPVSLLCGVCGKSGHDYKQCILYTKESVSLCGLCGETGHDYTHCALTRIKHPHDDLQ